MITPPHPGFDGKVQILIRSLKWAPVDPDGEIGELSGGWLAIASENDAAPAWHAGADAAPEGVQPRLVTREAFEALQQGHPDANGVIRWQGKRYRLADIAKGGRLVASLVAVK
ncbi:hypothetical protein WMF18_01730 [Sorangium sp. So ce315]|uniref:hypothetical protein n=1 Tax=Sorangium sp. So ce315 TaxID=3133299 RepID=UPI003F6040EE